MTSIEGFLIYVEDIRLGLTLVEIDYGAGVDICGGGIGLLARDQCQLTYIWLGSMLFQDFGVGIDGS